MRMFSPVEPDSSGEAEHRDPAWQDSGRLCNYNSKRAKALICCIQLHRRIAASVTSEGSEAGQLETSTEGIPKANSQSLNFSHASLWAAAVKDLPKLQSRTWCALLDSFSLCIAVIKLAQDGSTEFWHAFNDGFQTAIQTTFGELVRSGSSLERPYFCWTLLSQLRCCSLSPRSNRQLDFPRIYVAAASQVHAYASKVVTSHAEASPVSSQTGEPGIESAAPDSLESAEVFFQALRSHMPSVEGAWGSSADTWSSLVGSEVPQLLVSNVGAARGRAKMVTVNSDDDEGAVNVC